MHKSRHISSSDSKTSRHSEKTASNRYTNSLGTSLIDKEEYKYG
jgi:hypothetical protein